MLLTTIEIKMDGAIKNLEKTKNKVIMYENRLNKKIAVLEKLGADPKNYTFEEKRKTDNIYWAYCDMEHVIESIENSKKKVKEFDNTMKLLQEAKKDEIKRNEVPNVPAVEKFLSNWKILAKKYYVEQFKKLEKVMEDKSLSYEDKKEYIRLHVSNDVLSLKDYSPENRKKALNKMLENEVIRKRIDLYKRCSAVVGVITDASRLYNGNNLSINGVVIGENCSANVRTIEAGGYNIQVLHYRVLVNKI